MLFGTSHTCILIDLSRGLKVGSELIAIILLRRSFILSSSLVLAVDIVGVFAVVEVVDVEEVDVV